MSENRYTVAQRRARREFAKSATSEEAGLLWSLTTKLGDLGLLIGHELAKRHGEFVELDASSSWTALAHNLMKFPRPRDRRERREMYHEARKIIDDHVLRIGAARTGPLKPLFSDDLRKAAVVALAQLATATNARTVKHAFPVTDPKVLALWDGYPERSIRKFYRRPCVFVTTLQLSFNLNTARRRLSHDQVGRLYARLGFEVGRVKINGHFYHGVFVEVNSIWFKRLKRVSNAVRRV